jgi:hypothetical protein
MAGKHYIGQLVVFLVIGTLVGYNPMSAKFIKKILPVPEKSRRFLAKASLISLIIATLTVGIYELFYPLVPWEKIPHWVWAAVGLGFWWAAWKKFRNFHRTLDWTQFYNAAWYFLAGLLIALFETLDPQGLGNIFLTLVIVGLAVITRLFYWIELHQHANDPREAIKQQKP